MVETVKVFWGFATDFPQMIFFIPAFIVSGGFVLLCIFSWCRDIIHDLLTNKEIKSKCLKR